ncbi:MAG: AI-2E family transporter [Saprospiraceae bacterium]|uniref:AI-2E family transporter n=1 Tax=Candidatus Opimibacter skivensis TaxID=2982028 RepID=A0A9D7XM99_9BACT|nr:AI-2E family transporter [Candidatus Opimibacter skivensis]
MIKNSNQTSVRLPFYARISLILIGLFVLVTMLSIGQIIIVPLLFAAILSILLSTIVDALVRIKVNRIVAIAGTILVAVLIGALFTIWISSKATLLIDAFPALVAKFDKLQAEIVSWASWNVGIDAVKINAWINSSRADLMNAGGGKIGSTLLSVGGIIGVLLLLPVYIFLLLYYQPIIIEFFHRLAGPEKAGEVDIILGSTKDILKGYFAGLLIELVIVAILDAVGLLVLGIQFAIIIGILGAVLNMIPYIGGAITLVGTMLIALLTKDDSIYAVYVALLFFTVQIIDNNFIMPKIVGSKVKINALVAIVAVIAGGFLWGVAGMFLAIPITALIKVIFDRIPGLEPWGFVLGDTMPPMVKIKLPGKRKAT